MNSATSPRSSEKFPASLEKVRGVILDLDGTLYDQKRLRLRMASELIRHYLFRPWLLKEVLILFHFRRHREMLAEAGASDVSRQQFVATAGRCSCSVEQVESVVQKWLFLRPLPYLASCRYPFVDILLSWLSNQQIMVAVLSDYPPEGKLKALRLGDVPCYSSTDSCIDRLKPDPAGLLHICQRWNLSPGQCLVIGDRDDRDGEAARRAGMHYIIANNGLDFARIGQLLELSPARL